MPNANLLKVAAFPISALTTLAETADNYLALSVILGFNDTPITTLRFTETNPNDLALKLTLLGICAVSAIPEGLVVFYHMLKKSQQTLEQHAHHHDGYASDEGHDHKHHHACPTLRKALSIAINGIGLVLRTGLTIVSVKEFMSKFVVPFCGQKCHPIVNGLLQWGPGVPVAIGGRFIGGFYTEAAHTHEHIAGHHHAHTSRSCLATTLTLIVYATTFTSHALGYFFDVKEITDETPDKPQWAQYTCYGIGLLLCGITALQDSFLEGHHVAEVKDFAKTLSCRLADIIGIVGAIIGMLVHAFPGFAGGVVFLREFNVKEVNCWIAAGVFASLDMLPSLALHGRYIIEACRDLSCCFTDQQLDEEDDMERDALFELTEDTPLQRQFMRSIND